MTTPLTLDEAAAKIGMSASTIVRLCKAGELEHTQVFGGCYAIDPASLEQWASANIAPAGWLTSTEAAKIIGCHGTNITRYVEQGRLTPRMFGAKRYVHQDEVDAFAKEYKGKTPGERKAEGGKKTAAMVQSNWATIAATKPAPKRKPAAPVVKWASLDEMIANCHTAVRLDAMGEVVGTVQRQRAGR
jgi:excisionase family DNA binding protein